MRSGEGEQYRSRHRLCNHLGERGLCLETLGGRQRRSSIAVGEFSKSVLPSVGPLDYVQYRAGNC